MKYRLTFLLSTIALLITIQVHSAEVSIIEKEGSIEVHVDGKLFTAWQHKSWGGGYLYPVMGPDGENITRHYPMKKDVANESADHAHHRSIRFSHRNVNGFSFWAPDHQKGDHTASIDLIKVLEKQEGETGKVVLLNHWMGDKKKLLKETLTLRFYPLEKNEMLMDYDVELETFDQEVEFRDEKDGGMMVRVAGTMKAYDRHTKQRGKGTITNSRGDENENAWGKQAEWCDYSGPSQAGNPVGVTIFDHPGNLRYPTHWHARTYGLLTANRFGKGYFESKSGAKRGDGNYLMKPGDKLKLRHRFFFHHGNVAEAGIEKHFDNYSKADQN